VTLTLYGGIRGPSSHVYAITGEVRGEWLHYRSGFRMLFGMKRKMLLADALTYLHETREAAVRERLAALREHLEGVQASIARLEAELENEDAERSSRDSL